MEVIVKNIIKFFIVIFLLKFVKCAEVVSFTNTMQNRINEINTEDYGDVRWIKHVDAKSWIWRDHEFGTGVGYREELLIKSIELYQNQGVSKSIKNWQVFEYEGEIYMAGSTESTILIYHLNKQTNDLSLYMTESMSEKIINFKVIENEIYRFSENSKIYFVLSLEDNQNYYLKWYNLLDRKFSEFGNLKLDQAVKNFEYFNINGQCKLILLLDTNYFNKNYTNIEIHEIKLNGKSLESRKCNEFSVENAADIQLYFKQGNKAIISLFNDNKILLLELKDNDIENCQLQNFQIIPKDVLSNGMYFENSYKHYLVILGSVPNFFKLRSGLFEHDEGMENYLKEIGNINSINSLPVDTYRDEVVLLLQMKNSSISALYGQGSTFKPISFDNKEINNFDMSKATIIPNYGFLSGDSLVKFNVELRALKRSEESEIEKLLKTKSTLEEILEKQEYIINKTLEMVDKSNLANQEAKGFFNLSEVEVNNLTVDNTNFLVKLGIENLTLQKIQSDYDSALGLINNLEEQMDRIEDKLKDAISTDDTDVYLNEIDITGNFEVKGLLSTNNLEVNNLNGISMNALMNQCSRDVNSKIMGVKSFPTIKLMDDNIKIQNLNGIPLINYEFVEHNKNYMRTNLSNLTKLVIEKSLNFSYVSGMHWENSIKNLVLKNEKKFIPGTTIISGKMSTRAIRMDYLNNINYPYDYIVKSDPEIAEMTSEKFFKILRVSDLTHLKTINDIDADDFIILNADQNLTYQITFENLVIDKSIQIDGEIKGLSFDDSDIDPDLTLLNGNIVHSNAIFNHLLISGQVYIENSINGTSWTSLDDLVMKEDEKVVITGTKTFLNNVNFKNNLEIKNKMINGHFEKDFITIDSWQILPNLSEISGNVKFTEVFYEDLKDLEDKINSNVNDEELPICMKKSLVFKKPPIINEFSSSYFNYDIEGSNFLERLEFILENVHFEHLKVKKLIVDDLVPTYVNGVNFEEFESQKFSKNNYQYILGNITINYLEINQLYTDVVNNMSSIDLKSMVENVNALYDKILNGTTLVDSLNVTGSIITPVINNEDMNYVLDISYIEQFTFGTNQTIENIVVENLVNGLNFTKLANDSVLKTENNVVIKGSKYVKKFMSEHLQVEHINDHSIDDVISTYKNQMLIGPVKVKGVVNVQKLFNSTGNINDNSFKNISNVIHKLEEKTYKLNGDFEVRNNTFIKDLNVFGQIQEKDVNEFMNNLIYLSKKENIITGIKIFNNSINFADKIIITNNLNAIDLKNFYGNAVLIDKISSLKSKIIFENDIILEDNLEIKSNLKVNKIKGIDIDDLIENAVYVNRPTAFREDIKFSKLIFKSDIIVETWNNVEMDTLFILNKDETIDDIMTCVDVLADNLEIGGYVNGEKLSEFYENTFMLSTDQHITGKTSFLNYVNVNGDLNSQYINDVDITKTISLNDPSTLKGNLIFKNPLILNNNLQILGNLNGYSFSEWQSSVITKKQFTALNQTIFGYWRIYGNVTFNKNVGGSSSINGVETKKLAGDLEKQNKNFKNSVSNKMKVLKNLCEDLQLAKNKVDNVLYKFKSFDYLAILQFDQKIASIHHFEFDDVDYLMVNFETCLLDVFAYINGRFELAANVSNFGHVKQFITLNYEKNVYFVTIGSASCGRNSGNIWSLENYKFKHVLDLGNVTNIKKLGKDAFAIVVNHHLQEWDIKNIFENSFKPINEIPIRDKNTVQFFSIENATLLASRDAMYEVSEDSLEFYEYENPFNTKDLMNFQAGINQREYILYYDERISSDYIFICSNDLRQRRILQSLYSHKPSLFTILNIDNSQESLLIFAENKRKLQIYEYMGIEGFKPHSSIRIKVEKMFNFQLQKHPHFVKTHCLGVIQDNKLTILEAKMYGERLNINDQLVCDAA